jgi:SpoVK/Ycf46/Vps4 family AAA+-type ATPase
MRALLLLALLLPASAHAEPNPCLAAAASRYIGESERNLSRTLALAEQSDVILAFDEADALFGARTQTRDAHDRYANQEVSYLLARIENFQSIERLASNDRRTIVAGFDRRSRNAGLIILETETGARVLNFTRATRRQALEYAQATLEACPVVAAR